MKESNLDYREFEKICDNWKGNVCLYGAGLIGKTWGYDVVVATGLKPDFYCDKKYGRGDRINGLPCIDIYYLEAIRESVLVFLTLKEEFQSDVKEELMKRGISNIVALGDCFFQDFIHSIQKSKDDFLYKKYECIMDDKKYVERRFEAILGYKLNLDNPRSFNEKIQWLKLHERKPIYTTMVDKYAVKEYVAKIIGCEHIIPTIGVWKKFEDIDFDSLPNQFVLKCTHDSGGIVICYDKTCFDYDMAKIKLNKCLNTDYYLSGREWPYKNVSPKIIAEKYMTENFEHQDKINLKDYKIHCFNGKAKFIQCICERNLVTHSALQKFYTTYWNELTWTFEDFPRFEGLINKPKHLEEMVYSAEKIAQNHSYIRVDFYDTKKEFFFGECTFFPLSGMYIYQKSWNRERDIEIGEMIY